MSNRLDEIRERLDTRIDIAPDRSPYAIMDNAVSDDDIRFLLDEVERLNQRYKLYYRLSIGYADAFDRFKNNKSDVETMMSEINRAHQEWRDASNLSGQGANK